MEKSAGTGKKISFRTLGCRLNQYETDALLTRFHQAGYVVVDSREKADITVINTCTVTNQSDQKSRNTISHAARKNPGGIVVVTGCMANNHREKLESSDHVTYVVENPGKSQIVSLVDAHFKGEVIQPHALQGDVFGFGAVDRSLHTRTFIKIQDGCDNYCTYCIVPSVRGRAVSRAPEQVLDNVRQVVDFGFREIVITGVNIGRYTHQEVDFEGLLEKVLNIPGDFRVRISSMEPEGFGPDFHRLFGHPKLTPHLHLCLQSGSDPILLKMRRMYTVSSFMEVLDRFRKHYPDFNFTTDIIVGFPGENDEDFSRTLQVARDARFSHIHTFRYSRRRGTRADRMVDQVDERVKAARRELIRAVSAENRIRYMESMKAKDQTVLVEQTGPGGIAKGYGEHYLPVRFTWPGSEKNRFCRVVLGSVEKTDPPVMMASLLV